VAQNVTDWVWKHSRAVNGSLIVLLAIAHEANRDGEVEMGASELASKCRLGERTVQTAVRELADAKELEVRHGGGRGRRTWYRLTLSNPAGSAGFEPGNPAGSAPIPASNPADPAGFTETPQDLRPFAGPPNPADPAPFTENPRSSGQVNGRNPADSAGFEISDVFITSTGRDEVQVKDASAITSRPDVERLCVHLADRIEANGSRRPPIGRKWRDAARLMIDRDHRTEQQVMAAIDWCQENEFWRSNILSMPKLREKYEQLRLQAGRVKQNGRSSTTDDRVRAGLDLAEKYARQEQQERRELP
jgi:hypothetical protein